MLCWSEALFLFPRTRIKAHFKQVLFCFFIPYINTVIIYFMNVLELNQKLQLEAKELLNAINLPNKLKEFGEVVYGGSYVYGTMVDRDIDIAVIVGKDELGLGLRKQFMNMILDIKELDGLEMTDRVQNHKDSSPYGIWFAPKINYKDNKWNIDIWLVSQDEPYSLLNLDLPKRMLNITDEQRLIMLDIKFSALQDGTKGNGVTASQIYKAVLDDDITTYDEFIKLKS